MTNRPTGTVTFLFTDVEASTRRWEEYPDAMRVSMARHDAIVREAIETHAGSVFTTAGDEFCAAFSSPQGGVEAAIAAQLNLAAEDWGVLSPFRVRMALHTGNADEREGDYFGPPLNRCARLLSTGHGGQVIVSSVTAQLIRDHPPLGVELKDLGAHELKDLDRPEHVYQLVHAGLPQDFPPLRSRSKVRDAADLLAEGRQAHASENWESAFRALSSAATTIELDAEDLQRLGEAAFWTGRSDEGITAREKAYGAYVREGKSEAGALVALTLAESYKYRLAKAISKAWVARAERLVAEAPGTEAEGYLLRWKCVAAFEAQGDPDTALSLADDVIALGSRLGNRSLEALGLQDKGRILVSLGRIEEGMSLVDEAMVSAVAGELDPDATGRSYCNMLSVCDEVADYQRASEWSTAAQAWCEQHSDSAYPGVCRITRAELKWLHGDWEEATADLDRAMQELTGFTPIVGAALYQAGEIELRAGRYQEAERRFRSAHEHGYPPVPGMASLRLRQGDAEAAEQLLDDALGQGNLGPLARAQFLPALIDARLARGRTAAARDALTELERVAEMCGSTAMLASSAHWRAALAMAEGSVGEAIPALHSAIAGWTELQMPYETAQSRLLLAQAQYTEGNHNAAGMEMESARSAFERLGAEADLERIEIIGASVGGSPNRGLR